MMIVGYEKSGLDVNSAGILLGKQDEVYRDLTEP